MTGSSAGARSWLIAVGHAAAHPARVAGTLAEMIYWALFGWAHGQQVRAVAVLAHARDVCGHSIVPVTFLGAVAGAVMARQSSATMLALGVDPYVTPGGIGLVTTRELAPLLAVVFLGARTGSALVARFCIESREIAGMRAFRLRPVRVLGIPLLIAAVVMLPFITFWVSLVALYSAYVVLSLEFGWSMIGYLHQVQALLEPRDLLFGLGKSAVLGAMVIAMALIRGQEAMLAGDDIGSTVSSTFVRSVTAILVVDMVLAYASYGAAVREIGTAF